jgi:hypothetical protein
MDQAKIAVAAMTAFLRIGVFYICIALADAPMWIRATAGAFLVLQLIGIVATIKVITKGYLTAAGAAKYVEALRKLSADCLKEKEEDLARIEGMRAEADILLEQGETEAMDDIFKRIRIAEKQHHERYVQEETGDNNKLSVDREGSSDVSNEKLIADDWWPQDEVKCYNCGKVLTQQTAWINADHFWCNKSEECNRIKEEKDKKRAERMIESVKKSLEYYRDTKARDKKVAEHEEQLAGLEKDYEAKYAV